MIMIMTRLKSFRFFHGVLNGLFLVMQGGTCVSAVNCPADKRKEECQYLLPVYKMDDGLRILEFTPLIFLCGNVRLVVTAVEQWNQRLQ